MHRIQIALLSALEVRGYLVTKFPWQTSTQYSSLTDPTPQHMIPRRKFPWVIVILILLLVWIVLGSWLIYKQLENPWESAPSR